MCQYHLFDKHNAESLKGYDHTFVFTFINSETSIKWTLLGPS